MDSTTPGWRRTARVFYQRISSRALPETLEACAARELTEETGLTASDLRLVGVYSAPGRDPRGWTVTAAYSMHRPAGSADPVAADDAADCRWFALDALPELAFDHAAIIADAVDALAA